jgi:hypothetical protein
MRADATRCQASDPNLRVFIGLVRATIACTEVEKKKEGSKSRHMALTAMSNIFNPWKMSRIGGRDGYLDL